MAARIIPPTDDAEFPYDRALALIREIEDVVLEPADIPGIMESGRRMGWPQSLLDDHMGYLERGKCFAFRVPGGVRGTLWETNIFFAFEDRAHQETCEPQIEQLAARLGCRILPH